MESSYNPGESFPAFPYPPYDIQEGFMHALYQALDKGGVGLFESPTGTGKTLSLICGSLHWLQDHRKREAAEKAKAEEDAKKQQEGEEAEELPDWMRDFDSQKSQQLEQKREEERQKRLAKAKASQPPNKYNNNSNNSNSKSAKGDDPDDEFLVDDWTSDAEGDGGAPSERKKRSAMDILLESDEEGHERILGEHQEVDVPKRLQILFCSRTHSQLSQFVGELHRTPFADDFALVALGSRKTLCINEDVLRLNNPSLVNERCLDLQNASGSKKKALLTDTSGLTKGQKASKSGKCPYLGAGTKAADTTRDIILAQPIDIEELAKLGKRKSVCPYYAARRSIPEADIILVPYASLLMQETRESLGLHIEGNVIIVDEAHNLVDAVNNTHSAELPSAVASTAARQLTDYFERFRTRLALGNAKHIQLLINVGNSLAKMAENSSKSEASQAATATTVNDFLFASGLDNINMFKLVRYVRESKIVFKVAGYAQAQYMRSLASTGGISTSSTSEGVDGVQTTTGALHALVSFLQALTNEDVDGRIIVDAPNNTLKFVLLNAAAHFAKVVSEARAVILASGTLSPLESVLHLFPSVPSASIHQYSCGHVVGKERLLAMAVGAGPSGKTLDFRMESRATHGTIDELGRLVVNACNVTPGGVVVFFPSFSYADQVYQRWSNCGLLSQLSNKKKVFREPRLAGEVEATLEEYAACIEQHKQVPSQSASQRPKLNGAVMLCVVGGKLAEGINFGDDLGRLVIMAGLPYPNAADPELKERLLYLDKQFNASSSSSTGGVSGREHYQNLCMKAVNQCIGRVIRHRGDYAAIMLVDTRYAAGAADNNAGQGKCTGAVAKLPEWIKQSLVACNTFAEAQGNLVRFFKTYQH